MHDFVPRPESAVRQLLVGRGDVNLVDHQRLLPGLLQPGAEPPGVRLVRFQPPRDRLRLLHHLFQLEGHRFKQRFLVAGLP
ncbi:hypothetical protein D1872_318520 [compost metagenome]